MDTTTAGFELTDAERAVRGLEFADSELRIRPARRSVVEAAVASALFVGFGAWMVADPNRAHLGRSAVRNPEANVTMGIVLIVLGVIAAYGQLRPVARADAEWVELRGLFRSRRYTWTQVAEVRVDVTRAGRSNVAVGGGSIWLPWRRRPFEASAVLQLATGEIVVLRSLVARVSSTLPDDHPTALKVAALARLRSLQHGPPVSVAPSKQRERIGPLLVAVAASSAVSSWAAGRPDIDPILLVLAVVFMLMPNRSDERAAQFTD